MTLTKNFKNEKKLDRNFSFVAALKFEKCRLRVSFSSRSRLYFETYLAVQVFVSPLGSSGHDLASDNIDSKGDFRTIFVSFMLGVRHVPS